jgi:hypothetical protein
MQMEREEGRQRRDDFLIAMYGQMWGNVERHILVIWQSVAALAGAFAALALIENSVLPVDLVCALLALVCAWVIAHVVDANYWFRRNLLIVANIERQFLVASDAQAIHPYFQTHRQSGVLDHLTIQACLAGGVYVLLMGWHFCTRVAPGFSSSWSNIELSRTLPYVVSLLALGLLLLLRRKQSGAYHKLLQASPGQPVRDTP